MTSVLLASTVNKVHLYQLPVHPELTAPILVSANIYTHCIYTVYTLYIHDSVACILYRLHYH